MIKLIIVGILSGALFSTTFLLNEFMSTAGGHWFWSGLLRYFFMILLLTVFIIFHKGTHYFKQLIFLFFQHWKFWLGSGSIGFGAFYALICFSADYAPGWVIAATWQFTIVSSLLILLMFGRSFSKKAWLFSSIIFCGVILVNYSQLEKTDIYTLLLGAAPVMLAAFCYPLGNQLLWEANSGTSKIITIGSPLLDNSFNKVLLMSLGSLPLWGLLWLIVQPTAPNVSQVINTFYVALLAGIAATSLFLYGRNLAKNTNELAAIDATMSSQVIFSLLGGVLFLNSEITTVSVIGLLFIMLGMGLYMKFKPIIE